MCLFANGRILAMHVYVNPTKLLEWGSFACDPACTIGKLQRTYHYLRFRILRRHFTHRRDSLPDGVIEGLDSVFNRHGGGTINQPDPISPPGCISATGPDCHAFFPPKQQTDIQPKVQTNSPSTEP